MICYRQWTYSELVDAKIGIMSHSLHYGSSIFDSIRLYPRDGSYYALNFHKNLKRFLDTLFMHAIHIPESGEDIIRIIMTLLSKNKSVQNPYVRLICYAWDASYDPKEMHFSLAIMLLDISSVIDIPSACYSWFHRQNDLIHCQKLSGNYAKNIFEQQKNMRLWYDYTLFLGEQWEILEWLYDNVFIMKDAKVYTPQTGNIVSGVNRAIAIEILASQNIECIEKQIFPDFLDETCQCVLTGSWGGIRSIRAIKNLHLSSDTMLLQVLQHGFEDILCGKLNIDTISLQKL